MLLDISPDRLGGWFPAYLIVNRAGAVTDAGPAMVRHCPACHVGADLFQCFELPGSGGAPDLGLLAATGRDLHLRARSSAFDFRGAVFAVEHGYFLALNLVPSNLELGGDGLQISDFAPSDPLIQGLLLVALQKAMLEESHAIAQDLARERQRSLELLERISRVAGYMAHDFNNFLSIIKLNSDRLLMSGLPANAQRKVRIILEIADRGSEITRSLMTLSHQRQESRTRLLLDDLIADNLAFFSTLAGAKVELRASLGAPEAVVDVSRTGLLNCLVNLIVNARDAMADGGTITIATDVRTVALDPAGADLRRYVAVRLSDSGPGMSAAVLSRVFEPLFSTKPHGSGIGLASVQEFALEMEGEVCLDAVAGEGTSVYLYLPLAAVSAPDDADLASPPAASVSATGLRVLIVEDEPYALEALCELVEGMGHTACAAANAAAAQDIMLAGPCDLMLSDVVLPGVGGLELARWVEARQPGIPVVLMSGYVPDARQMSARWTFIRKPIDTEQLRKVLQTTPLWREAGTKT